MKDLSIYFQPLAIQAEYKIAQIGSFIDAHIDQFPDLDQPGCAIFEVPEYRGAQQPGFEQNIDLS